jgi:thiamine pyrophosphokinase
MKKCYLFGAGHVSCAQAPRTEDIVIAADGGYDALISLGIAPKIIVGDMDSVRELPHGDVELIRYPVRKDETDMHLCYLEGVKRGADTFLIYGGTGGRSDHTLANLSLLLMAKDRGDRAYLMGDGEIFFCIKDESVSFTIPAGRGVSVFAASENCRISLSGLEYECQDLPVKMEMPIGVSNSSIGKEAKIKAFGRVLIMVSANEEEFSNLIDKR